MKAISYQPSVSLSVGQTPARQASGNALVYGTGAGYDAIGKGVGAVLSAYEKEREDDMVADITAAKNEYDKRISDLLYNENSGLMNRKLDNARGIGREYEEEEAKIRQDVMQNMLPKYEKAHLGFTNMVNPAAQRNFDNVRDYSLKQKDAYRDVNYTDAVNFKIENAQHYYQNPSDISAQLDEIRKLTWATYAPQNGDEWCRIKYDEIESKVVVSAIETAIANLDNDSAKRIMNAFGDRVPPAVLNRYRRGILESDKNDVMLTEAERIAKDSGYDDAKTDEAIDKLTSYEITADGNYYKMKEAYDKLYGTPYLFGGTDEGGIDCSAFTQKAYAAAGKEIPRTADAQLHWAEENGRFAANDGSYTPQAGDLVFITGTDSRFSPTDNFADSQDPDKSLAYKGVTHVGIVTESGTIMQAGSTNGVGEVPMSAFEGKIMGYGKAAGMQSVAMTAADKEELKKRARTANARHRQDEERRKLDVKNGIEDALFTLYEQGVTDPAQYMAIAKRYAGDPEMYRYAYGRAESYSSHSAAGSSKASSLSKDAMAVIKDSIDTGRYVSENALYSDLDEMELSPADRRTIVKYYNKAEKDAYDWASLRKDFQREFGKNEGFWLGAKDAAQDFINEYTQNKGQKPSYSQIYEALSKAAVKPGNSWFASNSDLASYEQMHISTATMRAMGLANAKDNGDGTVTITYPNNRTETVDKDIFDKQVKKYQ